MTKSLKKISLFLNLALFYLLCSSYLYAIEINSEAEVLAFIKEIREDLSQSPNKVIESLNTVIIKCKINGWNLGLLKAIILKVETYINADNIVEAKKANTELLSMVKTKYDSESLIRSEVIKLQLMDSEASSQLATSKQSTLLAMSKTTDDIHLKIDILLAVANNSYKYGEYLKTISQLESVYNMVRSIKIQYQKGSVLIKLSNINYMMKFFEKAIEYDKEALEFYQQHNNLEGQAQVLYNLSENHMRLNKLKASTNYINQYKIIVQKIGDESKLVWAQYKLAGILLLEKKYEQSGNLFHEALLKFKERESKVMLFNSAIGEAKAFLQLNNLEKARKAIQEAKATNYSERLPVYKIAFNNLYASYLSAKGDYKKAFQLTKEAFDVAQEASNKDKQQEVEKYRIQFNSKLKENSNLKLKADNQLKNQQIEEQTKQRQLWIVIIIMFILLVIVISFFLYKQIKNRNRYRELALKDHLTDSPNRRAILKYAENIFETELENGAMLSIAIIDIDYFKKINDAYGHDVGDNVLQAFATAFRNSIREQDRFGRYGGEEWLLVLSDSHAKIIEKLFKRIRKKLNDTDIDGFPSDKLITFSMGVAEYNPELDKKINDVINRADKKLYQAKEQGRDQFIC